MATPFPHHSQSPMVLACMRPRVPALDRASSSVGSVLHRRTLFTLTPRATGHTTFADKCPAVFAAITSAPSLLRPSRFFAESIVGVPNLTTRTTAPRPPVSLQTTLLCPRATPPPPCHNRRPLRSRVDTALSPQARPRIWPVLRRLNKTRRPDLR